MNVKQQTMDLDDERKVSKLVAYHILADALAPSAPNLTGGAWGWYQPADDETVVKLGSAVGRFDSFTLREILEPVLEDLDLWSVMEIARAARKLGYSMDDIITSTSLAYAEEVFVKFGDLDLEDQVMVRLKIASVNSGGDAHNWAVEYGDYLAQYYVRRDDDVEWLPYDTYNDPAADLMEELNHQGVAVPASPYDDADFSPARAKMTLEPEQVVALFPDLDLDPDGYIVSEANTVACMILEDLLRAANEGYLNIDWAAYDEAHPFDEKLASTLA